jgi:hypothetical protein
MTRNYLWLEANLSRLPELTSTQTSGPSCSRNIPPLTEPEGSLPCSHKPVSVPFSESDESSHFKPYLRTILILF